MQFTMAGIILFTQNYGACTTFYGDVLELDILHRIDRVGEQLTTYALGDTYLMVESGGVACVGGKTKAQSPVKLRFNVPDVMGTSDELRKKGVRVTVYDHSWGVTAEFCDPDGNLCALRSDAGFGA